MTGMPSSKKTTAGLLLVVILASSLVISNMIVFSAGHIAKKTDDLSVRMEVISEDIVGVAEGERSIGALFEYAFVSPIVDAMDNIASTESTLMTDTASTASGETSWSPMLVDSYGPQHVFNNTKFVVLAFDDGWKSQYENAKPILDKYGFKATFFVVCDYVGNPAYMGWRQIRELHNSGHDIQSHSMTHRDLTKLSQEELDHELGQSKQCLRERGIDATVFATPHNAGWNNATVIEAISRYYEFAKNGNSAVMYLQCDGWSGFTNQIDCRTYKSEYSETAESKEITFANRYSIRTWSHNYYDSLYQHNDTKTFEKFVGTVNAPFAGQTGSTSTDTPIRQTLPNSVVVLEYHRVDREKTATSTSPDLFEAEMRYLFDNEFSVLTMDDFGYDEDTHYLTISNNGQ